ncbi:hypothetical protein HD806DRAFT_150540 [Xylariaceae sp. AK1471]|nr:hypothetical protein HD806DRAFT_150540 [Xylariaceae sp. AK1471]
MADYATLKVPDLKKLLQERQLPVTGNKADLIARLQEHDKANEDPKPASAAAATAAPVSAEEDVIDYSDDDVPASKPEAVTEPAPTLVEGKTAEPKAATEPVTGAPAPTSENNSAETAIADEAKPVEAEAAVETAPKTDFSAHLPATSADDEVRKRAERAKRFGVVENADEEAKKKAERAARFGVDADETSLPSGLDAALPEKRERKRGREGASNADGERGAKRQQNNHGRRRGGRDHRGRGGRQGGGDRGDRGDRGASRKEGGGGKPAAILNDPNERAKAEARAKRFGNGA